MVTKAATAPVVDPTPAPAPVDPNAPLSVEDAVKGVLSAYNNLKTNKPWHQSMTYQGLAVASAGSWIAVHGASFLAFLAPNIAADLAHSGGEVVSAIGGFMVVIGRARLGGLS